MKVYRSYHISAAGSADILTNQGTLAVVNINTAAASAVLTLTDGNGGATIAVIDASVARTLVFVSHFNTGLSYTLAGGNADITITYE